MALGPRTIQVTPGETASCEVTLEAAGGDLGEIDLEVVGSAGRWASVTPATLPGASAPEASAQVSFTVGRSSDVSPGSYDFEVRAVPRPDPEQAATAAGLLEVAAFVDLDAQLLPGQSASSEPTSCELSVRNDGNTAAEVRLEAHEPGGALAFELPDRVRVGPGATETVAVVISETGASAAVEGQEWPFRITLAPDIGSPLTIESAVAVEPEPEPAPEPEDDPQPSPVDDPQHAAPPPVDATRPISAVTDTAPSPPPPPPPRRQDATRVIPEPDRGGRSATVRRPDRRTWIIVSGVVLAVVGVLALVGLIGNRAGGPARLTESSDFDPFSAGKAEHPQEAPFAIDGDPSTTWGTERYQRAEMGGLKPGVGLWVELEEPTNPRAVELVIASGPIDVELYLGDEPPVGTDTAGWGTRVGTAEEISGEVTVGAPGRDVGRYLLVWITRLPPDGDAFATRLAEVRVLPGGWWWPWAAPGERASTQHRSR